jgi:hypothetical protein
MRRHSVIMVAAVMAATFCSLLFNGATALAAGTWGTAQQVPGTAALNKGGSANINALSCGSAGNCSAGGSYTDRSGHQQAFVASQS